MTPDERLDEAKTVFDSIDFVGNEQNLVCLQVLLAIGQFLQNIDNRQAAAQNPG